MNILPTIAMVHPQRGEAAPNHHTTREHAGCAEAPRRSSESMGTIHLALGASSYDGVAQVKPTGDLISLLARDLRIDHRVLDVPVA